MPLSRLVRILFILFFGAFYCVVFSMKVVAHPGLRTLCKCGGGQIFKVSEEGIACEKCQTFVEEPRSYLVVRKTELTQYLPEPFSENTPESLPVIQTSPMFTHSPLQSARRPSSREARIEMKYTASVEVGRQEDERLLTLLLPYNKPLGLDRANPQGADVYCAYLHWLTSHNGHVDLERATEIILENWQSGMPLTITRRMHISELDWRDWMEPSALVSPLLTAMVIQDRLAEYHDFAEQVKDRKQSLTHIAIMLLNLERHIQAMVSQTSEAGRLDISDSEISQPSKQPSLPSAEPMFQNISSSFAGLAIDGRVVKSSQGSGEWDALVEGLGQSMAVPEKDMPSFKSLIFEELQGSYHNFRGGSCVRLPGDFTPLTELSEKAGSFYDNIKTLMEKHDVPLSDKSLNNMLEKMPVKATLALKFGQVAWLVRRMESGYTIYLPPFWTVHVENAEQATDILPDLYRSMVAGLVKPARNQVRREQDYSQYSNIFNPSEEMAPVTFAGRVGDVVQKAWGDPVVVGGLFLAGTLGSVVLLTKAMTRK